MREKTTVSPLKSTPSKLLVFGEYSILSEGDALAIPNPEFAGNWHFDRSAENNLNDWLIYLQRELHQYSEFWDQFRTDIKSGLRFKSQIPVGYGLGSSGALVAAVAHRYLDLKSLPIVELRSILGKMESFFHGKSSGLDPLVSYTSQGIRLKKNKAETVSYDTNLLKPILVDSGISRKTAEFVRLFEEKMESREWKKMIEIAWFQHVDPAINAWLSQDLESFWHHLYCISKAQYELLPEMIVDVWKPQWKHGLDGGKALFKLCGAGGGGFALSFEKKISQ